MNSIPAARPGQGIGQRLRLVMPHVRLSSFVRADIELLQSAHDVMLVPCLTRRDIARSILAAPRGDVVVCWFGSTRFLPLAAAAKLLGRRVLIISGGYDVAAVPALDYGNMYHRVSRVLGRALFRLADAIASISGSAADEARTNAGADPARIEVVYLALDPQLGAGAPATASKERRVLTVGYADSSSIHRKGILTLLRVARLLPEVPFSVAGPADAETMRVLQSEAGPNVRLEGAVSWPRLCELFDTARVYLQPSRHEAFGYSVAEAMLHNCLPVVTRCYSLPEVVGGAGLYVDDPDDLEAWKAAILRALDAPTLNEEPRARVIARFSVGERRARLLGMIDGLFAGRITG